MQGKLSHYSKHFFLHKTLIIAIMVFFHWRVAGYLRNILPTTIQRVLYSCFVKAEIRVAI